MVGRPGKGGSSNPNDWGMCGILSVSGNFGPPSVAEIIVDSSGYYQPRVFALSASVVPTMEMTCVLFTDFKGVPAASDAISSGSPPDGWSYKGAYKPIAGSAGQACIWAGLYGNVETINQAEQGAFGFAAAQYAGPDTVNGSQNVKTYAFCNGYSAASWKGWNFYTKGMGWDDPPSGGKSISLDKANTWCYMQGIQTRLLWPNFAVGVISASLKISSKGDYSIAANAPGGQGGTYISWNCLALKQ
jgi:hypothetical protein